MERRLCSCHSVGMYRNNRGAWQCRVKTTERGKRFREKRKSEGRCVQCGDLAVTGTLCFDCAGKRDMWNSTRS